MLPMTSIYHKITNSHSPALISENLHVLDIYIDIYISFVCI